MHKSSWYVIIVIYKGAKTTTKNNFTIKINKL